MSELYSLNLFFLESFLTVHFITKATPLIYIELLHKFTLKTFRTYTSHTQSIHINALGADMQTYRDTHFSEK